MIVATGRPSETLVAFALDAVARLPLDEQLAVLRRLARSQPTLVLDAVRSVETPDLSPAADVGGTLPHRTSRGAE